MMWLFQFPFVLGDQTTSPEFVADLFFGFLKVLFIIAGLLYLIFSVIVIRQIHVMEQSLVTSLAGVLRIVGYVHLLVSGLVLAYFLLAL